MLRRKIPTASPAPKQKGAARASWRFGLSERLLLLTVGFVLSAEALIYAPSLANYRTQWLRARIQSAEIALLAADAGGLDAVREEMLLQGAGVVGVEAIGGARPARLGDTPQADIFVDLRQNGLVGAVRHALSALNPPDRPLISVVDASGHTSGDVVHMVIDERELSFALRDYSHNILWLSGVISLLTGLLVFVACRIAFVRPMTRLAGRMQAMRDDPERAEPAQRRPGGDEVAAAERALADMQIEVRRSLGQRKRLARLGESVAKINHDLRNMLTSAQLITDRLQASSDPEVSRLAPRLMNAIDRAVELCSQTLSYTGSGEPAPVRCATDLRTVAHDALETAGFGETGPFAMALDPSVDITIDADPNHLFRIILNLSRNAIQAMERHGRNRGEVRVAADPGADGALSIDVADDGPGVPDQVRDQLFKPFTRKASGSGLGLSIARQLARQHGGDVTLLDTSPEGSVFRIVIADAVRVAA